MSKLHDIRDAVYERFKDKGVTKEDIDAVINSQFGFVVKVMKAGKMEKVRLTYLGTFLVTDARKNYLARRHEEKRGISDKGSKEDTP